MASISCQHIYKIYPGATAPSVTDFNLEIQDKEFIIFVGPSGCGKSTTLRMIAGLEEISKGEMYIGGRLINDVPPKDRDIAMVFQSYALYPHMTVYKNIAFGLELRKTPKDEIDRRGAHLTLDVQEMVRALERGDLAAVCALVGNVFEQVIDPESDIFTIRRRLTELGADAACMSGSGSAVFGLFTKEETARAAQELLSQDYPRTFLAKTV